MKCPYCVFEAPRRALHGHVAQSHDGEVKTRVDHEAGILSYELQCPFCSESLVKQINPRGKDPSFLEEFSREIRLVAFDLLLYHLEAAHPAPS